MKTVETLKDFRTYLRLEKGLSKNTTEGYLRDLIDFVNFVKIDDPAKITKAMINDYLVYCEKNYAVASMQRHIVSLRQYFRFLKMENLVEHDLMEYFDLPKMPQSLPEVLNIEEVAKMLESIDGKDAVSVRNYVMLSLLVVSGMRVSEMVSLKTDDLNLRARWVKVTGKGNKQRIIPLDQMTCDLVKSYMENERKELNKENSALLFLTRQGKKVSRENYYSILRKIAIKAQVREHVTPHMIRHTFATTLLNSEADLRIIQELLGHSDISTTTIYTHVSNQKLVNDYMKFHPGNRKKD